LQDRGRAAEAIAHRGDEVGRGVDHGRDDVEVHGAERWTGIPVALGVAAVHLLPKWSALSDSFLGAQHAGVTALSWTVVPGNESLISRA